MVFMVLVADSPFAVETEIGMPGYRNVEPHVAVNGNNVVVAWIEGDVSGNVSIYYRWSGDGGMTWGSAKRLVNRCESSDPFLQPSPDDSNRFFIVYIEKCPPFTGKKEYFIHFCEIINDSLGDCDTLMGIRPGDTVMIQDTVPKDYPRMAVAPGGKIVVSVAHEYRPSPNRYQIVVYRSPDGGITWYGPVTVDSNITALTSYLYYTGNKFYISFANLNRLRENPSTSRITIGLAKSTDYGATWSVIDTAVIWFLADSTLKCATRDRIIWKRGTKHVHTMVAKGDTIAIAYTRFNSMTTCNVRVGYNYNGGYGSWSGEWVDGSTTKDQIQPTITQSAGVWFISYLEKVDTSVADSMWRIRWGRSADRGWSWDAVGRVSSSDFRMFSDSKEGDYMGFTFWDDVLYAVWGGDRRVSRRMVYFTKSTRGLIAVDEVGDGKTVEVFEVIRGGVKLKVRGDVYDASGRLVFRGEGKSLLPKGVYFVKVGRRVYKVMVR